MQVPDKQRRHLAMVVWLATLILEACGDAPIPRDAVPDVAASDAKTANPTDAAPTDAAVPDSAAPDMAAADVEADPDAPGPDDATGSGDTAVPADAESDVATVDGIYVLDAGSGADVPAADGACNGWPTDPKVADFHVVATVPADGAADVGVPFTFTITFNAPVKAVVVGPDTVQVTVNGALVDGTFSVCGDALSFTSTAAVLPASRVDVTLSPLLQAEIGFGLQNQQGYHFYVKGYDGMTPYAQLARRYAPTLRQAVASGNDKYDQLRSLDYDGNWHAGDNGVNLSQSPALARVGWSVLETQSHFFVTYVYYWPHRTQVNAGLSFDNDASGATVAIARWPSEHPVAVTTWFKQKTFEEMWTWVTSESGLPKTGYVRGVLPEAKLFPPAKDSYGCGVTAGCVPKRFAGLLTSGNHQSCLWQDAGDGLNCTNNASTQANLLWIDYVPGVTPTEPGAAASPGPVVGYGLFSLYDAWWPRRQDVGETGLWTDASFGYVPPAGRPAGVKMAIGGKFYNKDADSSRPPWAWAWKGADFYDLPVGTVFLDPAWANAKRFEDVKKPLGTFDAAQKTGWSLDYCFNPYLYIDQRATANCLNSLP